MKKFIIVLIILCAFTMMACNGNGNSVGEDSQESTQDTQQDAN